MRFRAQFLARVVAFASLAMAAACEPSSTDRPIGEPPAEAGGYTLQVFAQADEQVYVVRRADGREVAARAAGGVSALMDVQEARGLLTQGAAALPAAGASDVSIRAPGFSLSITADEKGATEERARIEINAGGSQVLVDAAGEDDDGRANVRIAGADEETARTFIREADQLSAETKAQMLAALGL